MCRWGAGSVTTAAEIKAAALRLGFANVGICSAHPAAGIDFYEGWLNRGNAATMDYLARHLDAKRSPTSLLPGCNSIIAVALNYYQPLGVEPSVPRVARYALGRDYHNVIRGKLKALAGLFPAATTRVCVDSAPLLEREYAHRAGLGWFGKNTMLIDSRRGSWFLLGFVLTTLKLESDAPAEGSCGTCRACIDACPTGAIVFEDGRWQVNSSRCISYATIEHKGDHDLNPHGWTFGCDICQEVCPFNQERVSQPQRAQITTEPDFMARREWPELEQLAQIEAGHWENISRGSPLRRAGVDGIRRNAQKVLGRTKDR